MLAAYPEHGVERDRWIVAQRSPRERVDPFRPHAFLLEQERSAEGEIVPVATIFLTNRECPWRCVMCDLWQNTTTDTVPIGALPAQIDFALARLPTARQVKLYNSGSFFDPRAVPVADHAAIIARLQRYERVIVECHPALVGDPCIDFARRLNGQLEVAMGLETVHPDVLPRLNKRMSLPQFSHAAAFLARQKIALRAFILVQPPFMSAEETLPWAKKSLDFAFECGATVASLIPTRPGNGALDTLAQTGDFAPPHLESLEDAFAYGVALDRGRTLADLWDLERFCRCTGCFQSRLERMALMNLQQTILPRVACAECGSGDHV